MVPAHSGATSSVCGLNNDKIFLFGVITNTNSTPLVFEFNINEGWTNVLNNKSLIGRKWSASACDKNANYNIFGGSFRDSTGNVFSNELDILNTNNPNQLTLLNGSIPNIPPPMDVATATLLQDGRIVYIGGHNNNGYISMSKVYVYDTINGIWLLQINTNGPPSLTPRGLHTAVLTKDGRIIVYGGVTGNGPNHYPVTIDPLLVLDTTVNPFTWSIPNINNPQSAPNTGHTATLVGNYMIIAFGYIYKGNSANVLSNQILMLDVSDKNNYKWTNNFIPTNDSNAPGSNGPNGQNGPNGPNVGLIIGLIVGGILIIVIVIVIVCVRCVIRNNEYELPPSEPDM